MVKPPIVLSAGLMRAAGRGIENNEWWNKSDRVRAAARTTRPTSPAGTTTAGSTRTRRVGRWELVGVALAGPDGQERPADATYPAQTAAEARRRGARRLGRPGPDAGDGRPAARVRRTRSCPPPARRSTSPACAPSASTRCASSSPPAPTTRPAEERTDGRLPLQGLHARRDPAPDGRPRGRRRRPARDRAGHAAARGHRPLPPRLPRPLERARARRVRRRRAGAARVRGGDRRRDGRGARADRARLDLPRRAASTRSRCSPRSTTRPTSRCARRSSWRPNPAHAFRDDPRAAVAPLRAAAQGAARGEPAHGGPGDRLLHARTSRTSRRATSTRSASSTRCGQIGWLGRWLDRNGRADNPLQGLSMDTTLAPALAAASMPVAAVASPTNFALSTDGVGTTVRASMNQAYGADRAAGDERPAARRRARRRRPGGRDPGEPGPAVRQGDHRHAGRRDLPGQQRLREQAARAGEDARTWACRSAASRSTATAATTRTTTRRRR